MATPVFVCGAECGIVAAGATGGVLHWNAVNGAVTADTSIFRSPGLRSYKFTTAAGASIYVSKNLATPTIAVIRFYLYFGSLPSADCRIVEAIPGTGNDPCLFYQASTTKIFAAMAGSPAATGKTVVTGQWYLVEMRFSVGGTTRTAELTVDGTAFGTMSQAGTPSVINSIRFGINTFSTTANGTHYMDDLIISITNGDYPIGAGNVVGLSPNGDGTHNFSTAGDFMYNNATNVLVGATDTWQFADMVPMTGTGSPFMAVVAASNTEYLEWLFADSPSNVASVVGVEVVSMHYAAGTSANKQTMRLNDGGSLSDVFTDTDFSQTSICYNSKQYVTKPSGGAWTKAALDGIRARWNSSYGTVDESPVPFIKSVMLEAAVVLSTTIDYTLPADKGAFSETGIAAGLKAALKFAADRGLFTETGIAANLNIAKGYMLTADRGVFSETGLAAALKAALKMTSVVGAFSETGFDAGLRSTLHMTAAVGTFSETGFAAGVKAAFKMLAALGTFTETGFDAILTYTPAGFQNLVIIADKGTFTETGLAAALKAAFKMTSSLGTFSLSGKSASLLAALKMAAARGVFTETGFAAIFHFNGKVISAVGVFALTGNAAALRSVLKFTASTGVFTETGFAATFLVGTGPQMITAECGVFGLTGHDAILIPFIPFERVEPAYQPAIYMRDVTADTDLLTADAPSNDIITDPPIKRDTAFTTVSGQEPESEFEPH